MRILISSAFLIFSASLYAETMNCVVQKCFSKRSCPTSMLFNTDTRQITYQFSDSAKNITITHPRLRMKKISKQLYILDDYDILYIGLKSKTAEEYKGLFKSYKQSLTDELEQKVSVTASCPI